MARTEGIDAAGEDMPAGLLHTRRMAEEDMRLLGPALTGEERGDRELGLAFGELLGRGQLAGMAPPASRDEARAAIAGALDGTPAGLRADPTYRDGLGRAIAEVLGPDPAPPLSAGGVLLARAAARAASGLGREDAPMLATRLAEREAERAGRGAMRALSAAGEGAGPAATALLARGILPGEGTPPAGLGADVRAGAARAAPAALLASGEGQAALRQALAPLRGKAAGTPTRGALRLARAALEATGLGRGAGDEAPGATALRAELLRLEGEGHPGREDRDERYRAGGGRGR